MGRPKTRSKGDIDQYVKDWRLRNPEAYDKINRRSHEKVKASRDKKIAAIVGRSRPDVCDLCGGAQGGIVFDHCHATGNFRGWLCSLCNKGLGHFRDDPVLMRKAADYAQAGGADKPIPSNVIVPKRSNKVISAPILLSPRDDAMQRIKSIYHEIGLVVD